MKLFKERAFLRNHQHDKIEAGSSQDETQSDHDFLLNFWNIANYFK